MPTSFAPADSVRRSTATLEDVWFLSGPTQLGENLVHTPIDGDPFIIGRRGGVSLKLGFRTVSGTHASLTASRGCLMLRDLGSTNGTYVNGNRIEGNTEVPVVEEDLVQFAEAAFRVRRQSPIGMTQGTISENVCDQALALVQFDRLMNERLVRPHFQSIVDLIDERPVGYEVLGRGSVFGLESVGAMFQAAEQLNLEVELSQLLRWEGIRLGGPRLGQMPLFVNTHPAELEDTETLIRSLSAIREMTTQTPLVLEIHEAAVTDPSRLRSLVQAMEALDIDFAYDDFGSGQARLAELVEAKPAYVKFDINLIRGIDAEDDTRRRMLGNLVSMVRDLDIKALAEGTETAEEVAVCRDLGFHLAQGFYFSRPSPA